ncbi:MAG: GGDEF domain-containing protein [Nanoarchaeota archaeon]
MLEKEIEDQFRELERQGAARATITALRQNFSDLREKSFTDSKTGLYTHERLFFHLDEFLKLAADHDYDVSVLMADIDHFKQFNDKYGHIAGDDALRTIANTIKGAVKQSDVLARYGGEEFAVALPQTNSNQALELAKKIRSRVENTIIPNVNDHRTISIGVFTYNVGLDELLKSKFPNAYELKKSTENESGSDNEPILVKEFKLPLAAINAADVALYHAKKSRNSVVVYEAGMEHPQSKTTPSQGSEK